MILNAIHPIQNKLCWQNCTGGDSTDDFDLMCVLDTWHREYT